jgi:hypothetical protein
MFRKAFLVIVGFVIAAGYCFAGKHHIKGRVLDKHTSEPLAGTIAMLVNDKSSFIANDNGQFGFYCSDALLQDTLAFIHFGYGTVKLPVKQFSKKRKNIYLPTSAIELNEVVVKEEKLETIIRKAVEEFSRNYRKEPYSGQAYYQQMIKSDNKWNGYLDAIGYYYFDPVDKQIFSPFPVFVPKYLRETREKFVSTGSNSAKNRELGIKMNKWGISLFADFKEFYQYVKRAHPLTITNVKRYKFSLDSVQIEDNYKVYAVSFQSLKKIKIWGRHIFLIGSMLVDGKDYSLIRLEGRLRETKFKANNGNFRICYTKIKDKLYWSEIRETLMDVKGQSSECQIECLLKSKMISSKVPPQLFNKGNRIHSLSYLQPEYSEELCKDYPITDKLVLGILNKIADGGTIEEEFRKGSEVELYYPTSSVGEQFLNENRILGRKYIKMLDAEFSNLNMIEEIEGK